MTDPEKPKPTLDYRYKPPSYESKSRIGMQAAIGAILTLLLIVITAFVAAFASVPRDSDAAGIAIFIIGGIAVIAIGIVVARRHHRYPDERGWAIGIYIGLGLGGLFWGCCGFMAHAIRHV